MKITLNGSEKTLNDTCPLCSGTGMILNGWAGRMCDCQKKQSEIARLKNAMIPEEFEEARFKIYIRHTDMQKKMFNSMMEYLKILMKSEIRSAIALDISLPLAKLD